MNSMVRARALKVGVIIAVAALACMLSIAYASGMMIYAASYDGAARAAIIDQLHDDISGTYFQGKATEYLKGAGYDVVDVYTTKDITVDFYRKLPTMGYKFILIRSHSAINTANDHGNAENSIGIFTGEHYSDSKYTWEQLFGWVQKSKTFSEEYEARVTPGSTSMQQVSSESDAYFSIGSKFIDQHMVGRFPDSIVVIGGCNSLENASLADSLHRRGASMIVGWDRTVSSTHNDRAILETLKQMFVDKHDPKQAVESVMQTLGPDPIYAAELGFYPSSPAALIG